MRCASSSWRSGLAGLLLAAAGPLAAQECPAVDLADQKTREEACHAARGEWSRFGIRDYLCGAYSCAPRTADAGKACRGHAECEYLCVYSRQAKVGTQVTGECATYRNAFGCITHVDGGRIVGRVCID
jgi:hypothetical protein